MKLGIVNKLRLFFLFPSHLQIFASKISVPTNRLLWTVSGLFAPSQLALCQLAPQEILSYAVLSQTQHFYLIFWCSNWGPANANIDRTRFEVTKDSNQKLLNLSLKTIIFGNYTPKFDNNLQLAPLKQKETRLFFHFASLFTILFLKIQHKYHESTYVWNISTK